MKRKQHQPPSLIPAAFVSGIVFSAMVAVVVQLSTPRIHAVPGMASAPVLYSPIMLQPMEQAAPNIQEIINALPPTVRSTVQHDKIAQLINWSL